MIRMLVFRLTLIVLLAPRPLHSATISCDSEVTPPGGSFCVGVPIKCTVTLDTMTCISGGSDAVGLLETDLAVQVIETSTHTPSFEFDQANFTLEVIADYTPSSESNSLSVQVVSTNVNCSFSASTGSIAISLTASCSYPLTFALIQSEPNDTASVKGGTVLSFQFEMSVSILLPFISVIENITLTNSLLHPALRIVSNSTTTSDPMSDVTDSITAENDVHGLLTENLGPLVAISTLSRALNGMAFTNLSFQVQPYILPESTLYASFHVFYHYLQFGSFSLKQSIDQLRGFTLPGVTIGNLTFDLPYYNDSDHVPDTFPSQEGDIFTVTIPIFLPCVSTEITFDILLPEFWSEVYTKYFVNVTDVSITSPTNLKSIPQLCDYTDYDANLCDFADLMGTGPPSLVVSYSEQAAAGLDAITVSSAPLMYDITTGSSCADDPPDSSCQCTNEEIIVVITGTVLTDVVCENQTLADNITVDLNYTADMTSWSVDSSMHSEPSIVQFLALADSVFHAVNASTPAISLPISSHSGDAGDPFNVTFGVLHNGEYSSFTAYDLNYTFSIDPLLDPEENITICFYNTSEDPITCEEVPFVNYTIVREGYHEM